jgi:hypothetical protein
MYSIFSQVTTVHHNLVKDKQVTSLFNHANNCTPQKRCNNCLTAQFLSNNLSPVHFQELIDLMKAPTVQPGLEKPAPETLLRDLVPFQELSSQAKIMLMERNINSFKELAECSKYELPRTTFSERRSINEIMETRALYEGFQDRSQPNNQHVEFSLNEHKDDCSPQEPCQNCLIVAFLQEHLTSEQFKDLRGVMYPPELPLLPIETPLAEIEASGGRRLREDIFNLLNENGIVTIADLAQHTWAGLRRLIPGLKASHRYKITFFLHTSRCPRGIASWF